MPKNTVMQQEEDSKNNILQKLQNRINKRLEKMRDNYLNEDLKDKEKKKINQGKNRHEKGATVTHVFSYIINEAIEKTKSKIKLITSETDLPEEEKILLPVIDVSDSYIKEYKLNFDEQEKKKGYKCQYDGFLLSGKKIEMFLEFKAYTEATMWKRCLIDASLVKSTYPKDSTYTICMFESQIGSIRKKKVLKDVSYSAHSLKSYMQDKNLTPKIYIHNLMDGQRNPKKNIANPKYFKYANPEKVKKVYNFFVNFFNSNLRVEN